MSVVLTTFDFDRSGKLLVSKTQRNPMTGTPRFVGLTIVYVGGSFCGYCKQFLPAFEQVAQQMSSQADFGTIQIDSKDPAQAGFGSPQAMQQILGHSMPGVPHLQRFLNGRPWGAPYDGNRDAQALSQWVMASFQQ